MSEMTLEEYQKAFEKLGKDVPFGTACIIFVQGMASGGHPFARKILEMYAEDKPEETSETIRSGDFTYTVSTSNLKAESE